jgi:hypothetical protein
MPYNTPLCISRHVFLLSITVQNIADFSLQLPAFTASIILLLNICGAKHASGGTDPAREMEDVYKCMAVLLAADALMDGACVALGISFFSADLHFSFATVDKITSQM